MELFTLRMIPPHCKHTQLEADVTLVDGKDELLRSDKQTDHIQLQQRAAVLPMEEEALRARLGADHAHTQLS